MKSCAPGVGERRLSCHSGFVGIAINGSGYLRVRCRGKFCKAPYGQTTFHIFDLASGVLVRTEHVEYRNPSELLGSIKESA